MDIKDYISSGVIESVVLGLASPEETAELMQLREQYPALNEAIVVFEQSLEEHGLSGAVMPPSKIKKSLFDTLEPEFQTIPSSVRPTGNVVNIKLVPAFWKYAAAASVILFLVNVVASLILYNKYKNLSTDFDQLQVSYLDLQQQSQNEKERFITLYRDVQMMQDSSMSVVKMKGISGKESSLATVYWDQRTKDVYLFTNNLPPAEAGKQYQLWAIVDGKPVDAGVIGTCDGLCKLKNIPAAQAFAVTLEKAGGSAAPTMTAMYVMGKV